MLLRHLSGSPQRVSREHTRFGEVVRWYLIKQVSKSTVNIMSQGGVNEQRYCSVFFKGAHLDIQLVVPPVSKTLRVH